ncbi:MAG: hypothetical protein GXO78_09795 [Calditrichaeota bacterium]|nr:hypothetical protein [Calditrichota bacterium]
MMIKSLFLKVSWILGMLSLGTMALAQEAVTRHLDVELAAADLPQAAVVLFVQDTSEAALAVGEVWVDGQSLWLKQSDQPPAHPDVVHWNYDSTRRMLTIIFHPDRRADFNRMQIRLLPVDRRTPVQQLRVWAGSTSVFNPSGLVDVTSKITLKK